MLYLLYHLHDQISWLNVFKYITFRAMMAFLFAFFFVLFFQPKFIALLRGRGVKGQPIRDDGPKAHEGKKGTPTMGGLVIIAGVFFATLLFADLSNRYVWMMLAVMAGFGGLGFVDDWRKITQQNSKGLGARMRLSVEGGVCIALAMLLINQDFSLDLSFPFWKGLDFVMLPLFFVIFVTLVVVGTANAVNLTDGLDGLAIGPVMTVAATYALFSYLGGHKNIAEYLGVAHVPGVGEISIILSAIVAAGLGFLWYNTYPAQVFMGDLGALALGGGLGFSAVLVKHEVILVVAGGVFVVEALSVIIQRYYYKMTKRRVFRMAPIHHHFELQGWAEPKIIVRFWIISIVLALLALTSLKIR